MPHYVPGFAPGQAKHTMLHHDAGRVLPRQTHPWEGPSHPLSNVGLACNVDQSCFDRVVAASSILALPPGDRPAALEEAVMVSAHKCVGAVRYVCDYATKHALAVHDPLQSVGTSLADVDSRIAAKEAAEGCKVGHRVAARQRLNRAVSGYNKAFAKPLFAAMFPWLGSDYTGLASGDAPARETRVASHRFWAECMNPSRTLI